MMHLIARLFGRRRSATIAAAEAPDAAAIAALHSAAFRHGWSENEVESLLLDRSVVGHRAGEGRDVVGFILSRRAADEAEILSIAVTRARQSRGLARELLEAHLRQLAGLGTASVFLEVDPNNMPARRLYQRAGFREVGRRPGYYPQPSGAASAALVLRCDLP
jgi:ribosomal-protein-alanine N-acetyltransferase